MSRPKRKLQKCNDAPPEVKEDGWDPFARGIKPYIGGSDECLARLADLDGECAKRPLATVVSKLSAVAQLSVGEYQVAYEECGQFYDLAKRMVLQTRDCERRLVVAASEMFLQPESPNCHWYFTSYNGWTQLLTLASLGARKEPIVLNNVCLLYPMARHLGQFPTADDVFAYSEKNSCIVTRLRYLSRSAFIWDEFGCCRRDKRYSFVSVKDIADRLSIRSHGVKDIEVIHRLMDRIREPTMPISMLTKAIECQFSMCAHWTSPFDPTWGADRYMTDHTDIWNTITGWHIFRLKLQNVIRESLPNKLPIVLEQMVDDYLGILKLPEVLFTVAVGSEFENNLRQHLLQLRVAPGPLYLPTVKSW